MPDSFVGTWRQWPGHGPGSQTPLVITKKGDGYVATIVYWGPGDTPASPRPILPISMTRSSNRLTGTFKINGISQHTEIVYEPTSGHLTFAQSGSSPPAKPIVFVKVSDGTAYPTAP